MRLGGDFHELALVGAFFLDLRHLIAVVDLELHRLHLLLHHLHLLLGLCELHLDLWRYI